MKQSELNEVLEQHKKWLRGEKGGACANLRDADLRYADLRDVYLGDANLCKADLSCADLSRANLGGANLRGANLRNATLRGADLRNATLCGAILCDAKLPKTTKVENLFTKIKKAIDSGGILNMDNWHTCETTHCLAGWTTILADKEGKVADEKFGTSLAAALIINESCPYLKGKVPDFYTNEEDAMEFINECVQKELKK